MVFLFLWQLSIVKLKKRSKDNPPTPKQTLLLKHVFLLYIAEGRIDLICVAFSMLLKVPAKRAQHAHTVYCNIDARALLEWFGFAVASSTNVLLQSS